MRLVKTDLRGLSSLEIYCKGNFILGKMTDNPTFPNPTPSLVEFAAGVEAIRVAMVYAIDGGKQAYIAKDTATLALANMIKTMANYVSTVAKGDELIVVSAGFALRKRSTRIRHLDPPKQVIAVGGIQEGAASVRWTPVKGARFYQVFTSTTMSLDKNDWHLITVSTGSRCVVKGLEPLKYHYFKVQAMGVAGVSFMSPAGRALVV